MLTATGDRDRYDRSLCRAGGVMWRCIAVLLAAQAAFGWTGATNRDGSVFYFSSALRMSGTSQYFHPKIFMWDAAHGVRLYQQLARALPGVQPGPWYSLDGVDVSSDGATVAVWAARGCYSGCGDSQPYQTTIYTGSNPPVIQPETPVLSRNGRYAAILIPGRAAAASAAATAVIDLQTGLQVSYPGHSFDYECQRCVANDGTVLLVDASGFLLGRNGQVTALGVRGGFGSINEDATILFYLSSYLQITAYSIPTGQSVVVASEPVSSRLGIEIGPISDDGSLLAFTQTLNSGDAQMFVVRSNGTGLRQVLGTVNGASPIALSGDGSVLFASYPNNHLVRIDLATGQSIDIVPDTPNVGEIFYFSAGALAELAGEGLATESAAALPPLPTTLGGVQVQVAGQPAPLYSVSPNYLFFQVPWDLPSGFSDVELDLPGPNPFIAGAEMVPAPAAFYSFVGYPPFDFVIAAHQDFSAILSPGLPAKPGEVIHAYASALGPVNPTPASGEPAQADPLSVFTSAIACSLQTDSNVPVEVLFAGLAPGMFGVYQLDLRMPASLVGPNGTLACRLGDAASGVVISGRLPLQ